MRRRWLRILGTVMLVLGLLAGAWVLVVWQWKDPFTSLYTLYEQHKLSGQYHKRFEAWRRANPQRGGSLAAVRENLAAEARRYRRSSKQGEAIGKIKIPSLGLGMILVNGTEEGSLERGPGRDLRTYMPGQGELIYIAGHRTTYLAPFAHINDMRAGDAVTLEVPYGTFRYTVTGKTVVPADDLARLRSHGREVVILQACHPRFFATHRYLVYARPVSVTLPSGRVYAYSRLARLRPVSKPASRRASPRTASASRHS